MSMERPGLNRVEAGFHSATMDPPSEVTMMCARHLLVIALGVVLAACRSNGDWKRRPPVPQPPTRVIGGIPVATVCEDLPDLSEAEVSYLVKLAEHELKGLRVRRIVHTRAHPGEDPCLSVQFAYEETHARVRLSRSIVAYQAEKEEGEGGPETWSLWTEREPERYAEICAPGRSFLDETQVPESEVVRIVVSGDLTADQIVEGVDAVYDHVPAGEQLIDIGRHEDGTYAFETGRAEDLDDLRHLHGSTMEAERGPKGWKVTVTGEWIS